jgi:hypothetical protein
MRVLLGLERRGVVGVDLHIYMHTNIVRLDFGD